LTTHTHRDINQSPVLYKLRWLHANIGAKNRQP